jgi:hypothetical protein
MTTNNLARIPEELYREGRIDATMKFLGVESYQEGYEFAKGAFDNMLNEMGLLETFSKNDGVYKTLAKQIKYQFRDGLPVPQSKLTQTTYALVRDVVSNGGEKK